MKEEINTSESEANETNYQKISITDLIERFEAAIKERNKTCYLNKLIFELEEGENYTFNTILSSAGVITSIGSDNRVNIKLIFHDCIFKSKLYFYNLNFHNTSRLSFSDCKLESGLTFEKCKFINFDISGLNAQNINCTTPQIGTLYINKCNIQDSLKLSSLNLDSLYLENNELKYLFINDCENTNIIYLYENLIKNKFELSNCVINYFEYVLISEQYGKVLIQDSIFKKKIRISEGLIDNNFTFKKSNLKNFTFENAIIDRARIIDCKFEDYILYDEQLLLDKEGIKEEVNKAGISETKNNDIKEEIYSLVLYQYKALESNFDYYKNYEEAGKFHKRQFEVQRKFSNMKESKKYILWMYNLFSGYGESYVRSIFSFIAIFVFFTGLYLFTGLDYINNANSLDDKDKTISTIHYLDSENKCDLIQDIGVSLLYSLSNTLPIRKDIENIKPANGWTRFFSYLEITFQSIIITLFVIALRRKFKR